MMNRNATGLLSGRRYYSRLGSGIQSVSSLVLIRPNPPVTLTVIHAKAAAFSVAYSFTHAH
jgi:hypothetical protein